MYVRRAPDPLPLYYAAVLVAELAILTTVVVLLGTNPPFRYELGWAAVGSFVAMLLYSLRRRVRLLRNVGLLDAWLDAHIFFGLQGFLFAAYHCVGITLELSIATATAAIVVALVVTGIVGRYLLRYLSSGSTHAVWWLLHRPLTFLLAALVTLHVVGQLAYAL
jgi:hypothetical protein